MRGFINGVVFTLAALLAAVIAGVWFGVLPSGADEKPLPFERLAAHRALHASIARDTAGVENPLQPTDDNLLAGVKLYGANCAVCHGAADAKASNLAQGFYVRAPQLAKDGVEDDAESETHWKLVHGIRFDVLIEIPARCTVGAKAPGARPVQPVAHGRGHLQGSPHTHQRT